MKSRFKTPPYFQSLSTLLLVLLLSPVAITAQNTQRLLDSVDEVLEQVISIRGIESTARIERGVKSKEEIRSFIIDRIQEEYPRQVVEGEERFLKWFELIPAEMDLYEFMIDLLTEQVAGYYDPTSDTFYIADWIPIEIQKPVMAHELTHALQDQVVDLEKLLDPTGIDTDRQFARSAVLEGEGLLMMLAYVMNPLGQDVRDIPDLVELNRRQLPVMAAQYPVFGEAPRYLRESLLFPYFHGSHFVQYFLQSRSWSEMVDLYRDLPTSSEQILHPERFFENRDEPENLDLQDRRESLRLAEAEVLYDSVLGEFSWYLIFSESLENERAVSSTTGWDGDRVQLLQGDSKDLYLLQETRWDSEKDAVEFADAFQEVIGARWGEEPSRSDATNPEESGAKGSRRWRWSGPTGDCTVELEGRRVAFTERRTPTDEISAGGRNRAN